jgi:hypothetical protein
MTWKVKQKASETKTEGARTFTGTIFNNRRLEVD